MSGAGELMAAHGSDASGAAGLALAAADLPLLPSDPAAVLRAAASSSSGGLSGMAAGADSTGLSYPAGPGSALELSQRVLRGGPEEQKGRPDGGGSTPRVISGVGLPEGIYSEDELLRTEHVLLKYGENNVSGGYDYNALIQVVVDRLMDRSWNALFDLKFVDSIFYHRHETLIMNLVGVLAQISQFREISSEHRHMATDSTPEARALFKFREWYDRNPGADVSSRNTVLNDRKYVVVATIMMQQFMALAIGYFRDRISSQEAKNRGDPTGV